MPRPQFTLKMGLWATTFACLMLAIATWGLNVDTILAVVMLALIWFFLSWDLAK